MERTFVMVKPDGVQRLLVGPVVSRFEQKGFKIVGLKMMRISRELAQRHYGEHRGKPFFGPLVDYITSGPVAAMVLEGPGVVEAVRGMMGATNPLQAGPGTIRGDFGTDIGRNVVHGSDSAASAAREIDLFFDARELVEYERSLEPWILENPHA